MTGASANTAQRATWLTAALCFSIAVCEGFDLQAAGVAAPRLGPALGLTADQLAWFFSSSTFGLMMGAAFGGRLSDRFGRKAILVGSVAVFGLMCLATGFAGNVEQLLLFRFLTGVGLGGALPNLVALTAENAAPGRKNTSVGLLYAGLPAGGALASLLSVFGSGDDWRTVFYVGGLVPLLAIPVLIRFLPDSQQLNTARDAVSGGRVDVPFALLGEGRAKRTVLLWTSFFLALLTMYLLLNWLPTLLVSKGLTRPEASLAQLSFNVVGAAASFATGYFMDRFSASKVVFGAFVGSAVAIAILAGVPPHLVLAMAAAGFVGIAMSATQALLYAIAPANYPTRVRGTGVGLAVTVGRLGSAVGPLLAAFLLSAGRTPDQVLMALVPIILVSGLAALILTFRMPVNEARGQ
jgi:AAHS family 3-hydroxyphenylpropionic acid transporter